MTKLASSTGIMFSALCVAFIFVLISLIAPNASATAPSNINDHVSNSPDELMYDRNEAPEGWVLGDRATGDVHMNLSVALYPRNMHIAEELFRNISDPSNPQYGQHLTAEELNELVAPNSTVIEQIHQWFRNHALNLSAVSVVHTSIQFTANVSTVENLFNTSMYWFSHQESGERVVVQYGNSSVPSAIRSFVSGIIGLNDFPVLRQHYSVRHIQVLPTPGNNNDNTNNKEDDQFTANLEHTWKVNSFNHQYFAQTNTPQTVVNVYGLPDYHTFVPPTNYAPNTSQVVVQFPTSTGDQSFSPQDLLTYSNEIGHAWDFQVPSDRIVGTNRPSNPGTEGTLDIQSTIGVNPTAASWYYIMPIGSWILEFTNSFLARTGALPQVVSISYGGLEGNGTSFDTADANFLLMGLRGVTIVVASGDDGANLGAGFGYSCSQAYATTSKMHVSWPASSPYVLSVGASEIDPNVAEYYDVDVAPICGESVPQYTTMDVGFLCTKNGTERAASITNSGFTSGGGFSRKYARPSWQSSAVNTFVSSTVAKPPSDYYDTTKRAIPDVAALGGSWAMVYLGTQGLIGGTSLSAPIWAAIISLLNAETLRMNGTTLGFINPLLYEAYASDPTIFNDITQGDNICPIHKSCSSCVGWTATTGWDPITGLGTPNYSRLLAYITNRINASRPQPPPATCQTSYSWSPSDWSACSGNCYNPLSNPTQTRTLTCINACTRATVANSYCSTTTRPAITQTCRPSALCYAQWSVNPTGTCSKACGGGSMQLTAACRQSTTSTTTIVNMVWVSNDMCQQFTGYLPPTSQVCNNFKCPTTTPSTPTTSPTPTPTTTCTYAWQTGNFGSCSMGCYTPAAPANQTRSVSCQSTCTTGSTTTRSTVADSSCSSAGSKPATSQNCYSGLPTCYAAWVTEFTSECTRTCGGGSRSQYVGCWQQQGGNGAWADGYAYASVANSICTQIQGYTPSTTVTCNPQRC